MCRKRAEKLICSRAKTMKRFFNIHLRNLCAFIGNVFILRFSAAVGGISKEKENRQKTKRCKTMNNLSFCITRLFSLCFFVASQMILKSEHIMPIRMFHSVLELPDLDFVKRKAIF
jgi:hypothetical protein